MLLTTIKNNNSPPVSFHFIQCENIPNWKSRNPFAAFVPDSNLRPQYCYRRWLHQPPEHHLRKT